MGWISLNALVILLTVNHVIGFSKAQSWNKDLLLQRLKGRYISPFGEYQQSSIQKRLAGDVTERAVGRKPRRKLGRRRASPKCFITGSTVHCDGGLKFRGVGPIGRPGSPGLPGPKGDKGYRGSPGRPGPDGPPGMRGERGPKGAKGSRGQRGEKGNVGRMGVQGYPGIPSNCKIVPSRSYHCSRGGTGPVGSKGSKGPEGDAGIKGDRGSIGPTGEKGSRGAVGMPGGIGLYGALRLNGSCRELRSRWVIPNFSPIGHLKTECAFREYLSSLNIEADRKNEKIRYKYKCCPFRAADLPSSFM